jgi:hypothetical protein
MNYKYSTLLLAAAAITIINFQSCSKYDDNSGLHLKSKKGRLTGEWEVVKIDGQSPETYFSSTNNFYGNNYPTTYTANNVEMIWEFESDGDFKNESKIDRTTTGWNRVGNWYTNYGYSNYSYTYEPFTNNSVSEDNWKGEWEWEDNKEAIEIDRSYGSYSYSSEFEITKLTNKEMTLEDSYGNEWEFEKD